MERSYITIENLDAYKLARRLSSRSWTVYTTLNREMQRVIGLQFITSVDSVSANIAEGYGRYHYLDKVKFYYNARGSLFEAKHWIELLFERNLLTETDKVALLSLAKEIILVLNALIGSVMKAKRKE